MAEIECVCVTKGVIYVGWGHFFIEVQCFGGFLLIISSHLRNIVVKPVG